MRLPDDADNQADQPLSLADPIRGAAVAVQYATTRTGLAAQAPLSTGAFLKSSPELQYPDLQLHLTPALVTSHDSSWPSEHGLTIYETTAIP